jgi:hypothetical protein
MSPPDFCQTDTGYKDEKRTTQAEDKVFAAFAARLSWDLLLPHSRIKFLRIARKLPVDRALDRRVPSEGCEEIFMRIKISSETHQVFRGGVKIIILAGGLKRDTGIDARQVCEWADGAGYFRNSLDEELHRGEVVPHRMDVKKDLMLPFLPVTRKGVEGDL